MAIFLMEALKNGVDLYTTTVSTAPSLMLFGIVIKVVPFGGHMGTTVLSSDISIRDDLRVSLTFILGVL